MFTIPYTVSSGEWFPMRDELIFIAGGVIVVTLLLANFLLPLLAPNRNKDASVEMSEITIEVLRRTVEELTGRVTPDNRKAVLMIIDSYTKRITRLKQRIGETDPQGYMQLQIAALNWEKEYVKARLADVKAHPSENKAANDLEAEACERLLDQIMNSLRHIETAHDSGRTIWQLKGRFRALQRRTGMFVRRVNSKIRRTTPLFSDDELFAHTRTVQVDAIEHVIDRLYEEMGKDTYNTEHCSGLLLDYRRGEAALRARPNVGDSAEAQAQAEEVKRESYGIELGVIQDMYEAGDITRAQSKQLRRNVYVMSVDADAQI
jgi:CPA1 family monovalent cation:H+ antiporter